MVVGDWGYRYCGNRGNHWLVVETSILTQHKLHLSFNAPSLARFVDEEIGSSSGNPDGNPTIWWQIRQLGLSGSGKLRKEEGGGGRWVTSQGVTKRKVNVRVGIMQGKGKGDG